MRYQKLTISVFAIGFLLNTLFAVGQIPGSGGGSAKHNDKDFSFSLFHILINTTAPWGFQLE